MIKKPIMWKVELVKPKWNKFLVKLADNFSEDPLKLWVLNGIEANLELKNTYTITQAKHYKKKGC